MSYSSSFRYVLNVLRTAFYYADIISNVSQNINMNGSVLRVKVGRKINICGQSHLGQCHKRYTCKFFVIGNDTPRSSETSESGGVHPVSVAFCCAFCMPFVWPLLFIILVREILERIAENCAVKHRTENYRAIFSTFVMANNLVTTFLLKRT